MKFLLKLFAWIFGGGGLIVLGLYLTVIDFWTVPGDDAALSASILPTLVAGDLVVISKEGIPEISNLVRCVDPDSPDRFVVARVIAHNGDPITIAAGTANSKGRRSPSPRRCTEPVMSVTSKDGEALALDCWQESYDGANFEVLRSPEASTAEPFEGKAEVGKFFVVSDNRALHLDSRDYGQFEPRLCRRIYFRLWGAAGITEPHFNWVF